MSNLDYTISSGNVYDDIGLNDSAEMKMKAQAVMILSKAIAASGMTQAEVAAVLGIDQPKISKILRGQFRSLSLDKIFSYLIALDKDINITVSERSEEIGHTNIHYA